MSLPRENDPTPTADAPVPVEVIEAALQSFDDAAIVEEVRRLGEEGGHRLTDFLPELERLVRSSG